MNQKNSTSIVDAQTDWNQINREALAHNLRPVVLPQRRAFLQHVATVTMAQGVNIDDGIGTPNASWANIGYSINDPTASSRGSLKISRIRNPSTKIYAGYTANYSGLGVRGCKIINITTAVV